MTRRVCRSPVRIWSDCVFDGKVFREEPIEIVLDGPRIAAIAPRARELAPSDDVLDARGSVVAPGLVNAHVHVARGGVFEASERISARQTLANLEGALAAGVTTVGDMGCAPALIAALRAHVAKHPTSGPQIRAAGPLVTAPRGYPLDWMPPFFTKLGLALPCEDEAAARAVAERVARAGMDHVKLCVMHQSYSNQPMPTVTEPVARALVDEAHALGLRVLAHAHSNADYRVALAAGVDALMHSSFEPLDAELALRIRDAGVFVCPTLWVFESVCLGAEARLDRDAGYTRHVAAYVRRSWRRFAEAYAASGDVVPPGIASGLSKSFVREAVRVAAANLAILADAGVPIAFGNDASYGFSLVARPGDELGAMQRAGLDVAACLRAATATSAALLRCEDRGAIEVGRRADLLVLDARVRSDASAAGEPTAVVAAGRLVRGAHRARARGTLAFWGGVARTALDATS